MLAVKSNRSHGLSTLEMDRAEEKLPRRDAMLDDENGSVARGCNAR